MKQFAEFQQDMLSRLQPLRSLTDEEIARGIERAYRECVRQAIAAKVQDALATYVRRVPLTRWQKYARLHAKLLHITKGPS